MSRERGLVWFFRPPEREEKREKNRASKVGQLVFTKEDQAGNSANRSIGMPAQRPPAAESRAVISVLMVVNQPKEQN